ncbi:MAG TPA: cell surface protein SprA [Candidatus Krumholzibacteria bacterium]|nr:cell surface protein SprA [Candidatus Krumholzibacteria bacterium]HPD71304.1 cell surface protein SprA [Candidatus Krumholzibacteria bacterium]HRY38996.1 cell surface protein SprA [Candidatus Krumholzibacteria bacterium]
MTTRRRPTNSQHCLRRRRPRSAAAACPFVILVLLLLGGWPRGAQADPQYPGPLLYGLDPLLRTTADPRLLGVERLVLRERLLAQGVDPRKEFRRPGLDTLFRAHLIERLGLDLDRESEIVEVDGATGLYTVIRYPDWFFLFPNSRRLPGGFTYYPPRPIDAAEVQLFVDDADRGLQRQWAVANELQREAALGVTGGGRLAGQGEGLINLTIPVKLPRTLEKIIGRGEKTQIKITGREHIAIRGETTRSNQFTPNERVQSQSWFPDLDMEQQLQVNLSGQIGEKIFIEVDHNSETIGPEGTKIKLSYRGDEDEVIQSIETGDVGLTLPGGQLLGYSSNQSGLFGVKVTGQYGPADFTVVASKQKAESDSKSFNARGGEITEHVIPSYAYLNNRFFRLDLPRLAGDAQVQLGYEYPDSVGRVAGERIESTSVRVYRSLGGVAPQEGDVQYVAAAIDSGGRWEPDYVNGIPLDNWETGWVWRPVPITFLRTVDDDIVAVDLGQQMQDDDILAVTYDVVNASGQVVYRVGEDPNSGAERGLPIGDQSYYRMKLLKPAQRDYFTFQYVLRNIYPLGGSNIDMESFELRIETTAITDNPDYHTEALSYLRVFGLDRENPQAELTPDGVVDKHRTVIFDLTNGLLLFPLDFPFPFAAGEDKYRAYVNDDAVWDESWAGSNLQLNQTPQIYDWTTTPSTYSDFGKFNLVALHAAASNVINLGASNIEEGSETVTLDGRTLQRDVDYTIDYLFGTVELRGDAAGQLTPDSNVQVNYQYAPFFGGGQSSLLGLNLGYDLGRESKLATTWLYESNSIVGEKAKLGEEPSHTLVGNLNLNHTLESGLLTDVANLLAIGRRDKESTLAVSGEAAVSVPNPNTRDRVYIEDFEGAASTDVVTLGRLGWYPASRPLPLPGDARPFAPESRAGTIRWFTPETRVLRRYLNPELVGQERDETQQAVSLYFRQDAGWTPDQWGGIMRGLSRTGLDLSKSQFIEFWINDWAADPADRRGVLHIDFGYLSEDFVWRNAAGGVEYGTWQLEDRNQDGSFTVSTEDVGLDAVYAGQDVVQPGAQYSVEQTSPDDPYPFINNTAGNNYEDSEDLDGNTAFDEKNGYFTVAIDLRDTPALVDVAATYPGADLGGSSWRKYRIRLSDLLEQNDDAIANIHAVRHLRIWYEDPAAAAPGAVNLELAELAFLGSRWERQGIRKTSDETLLSAADLGPDENFFIGEINNKDNPEYHPPFPVHVENNIPEKESSLIVDFNELAPDHLIRIGKQVSAQGDDYTRYSRLSWWWHCPDADVADLDMFYRLGADSTNYYEVALQFADTPQRVGWSHINLDLVDLTNLKNAERGDDGTIRTEVADALNGQLYPVRIVGQPDLRRVTRYYVGIANRTRRVINGQMWMNDVLLVGVKRDVGLAEKVGLRLNMADVVKVDFDWDQRDAEYHGLNEDAGQGAVTRNWTLSTNFRVDDFVPLLGFQLPVSLSRRQSTSRPKYEINSDIEIVDEDRRNLFSTVEDRESYSVRLSHRQSRAAVPRYLVDPWTVQFSGSTTGRTSPTEDADQASLQGSLNFNLQIPGETTVSKVPLLGRIPIVRSIGLLPTRLEGSAAFTKTDRTSFRKDLDGTQYPSTSTKTKPGTLTGTLEYRPLPLVTVNYKNRSERDLLRRREWQGINIGEENRYSQDVSLTLVVPKATQLPQSGAFAPLRTLVRGVNSLRPSLTYQGSFVDDHSPGIRQPGDPPDVRSISNSNDWQYRAQLPLGEIFKSLVPERKRTADQAQQMIQEQERLMQQARQDTTLRFDPATIDGWDEMTPDQRREAEEEWLLEQAELRLREEGRELPAPAAGGGFGPRDLVEPVLAALRGFDAISFSFTDGRSSGYGRLTSDVPGFAYRWGFDTQPDLDDTTYATVRFAESQNTTVATKTRLSRDFSLDVKYTLAESRQRTIDSETRNYSQDWPDLRLNLTGLERLGLFGGKADDREAGWFRSSSFDLAYKHSKSVPNFTETFHNPRRSSTYTPRWNMTFHSGLALTLNGSYSTENQISSGVINDTHRLQVGLQVQHEFQAQTLLAKLGLYRPGNQPTVNMSVDLRFSSNTTDRTVPGATYQQAQQGTQSISLQPRFTYNITRNLSGAFSLNFSQNKNLATDLKTTVFGLGLEATFVF